MLSEYTYYIIVPCMACVMHLEAITRLLLYSLAKMHKTQVLQHQRSSVHVMDSKL